jgi:hypothetical protein
MITGSREQVRGGEWGSGDAIETEWSQGSGHSSSGNSRSGLPTGWQCTGWQARSASSTQGRISGTMRIVRSFDSRQTDGRRVPGFADLRSPSLSRSGLRRPSQEPLDFIAAIPAESSRDPKTSPIA